MAEISARMGECLYRRKEVFKLYGIKNNKGVIDMATILASIVTAVITGGVTLAGVLIANGKTQAVMEERIAELTREVREHNNFARRMPVLENKIEHIEERLNKLERE